MKASPSAGTDRHRHEPVSLRPGRAEDLSAISAIEQQTFGNPWPLDAYAQELERPSGWVVVLESAARVAGFACVWRVDTEAHLLRIAVDPAWQRRGYGRSLLEAVVGHALHWGCGELTLEVAASNEAALALYRRSGFCEIGRRKAYYRCPVDDAIVMRRVL